MRIYDGDFTISKLLDDCKYEPGTNGRQGRIVQGIDLDKLNDRLRNIPVDEIRRRRRRMNVFYQEVMVTADPVKGVSFTACLLILAHYNVINDAKSLK